MNYDPIHDSFMSSTTPPSNNGNHNNGMVDPAITNANITEMEPPKISSAIQPPNSMAHLMSDDIEDDLMNVSHMDEDNDSDNDNDEDNDNDNDNESSKKSKTKRPVSASIPKGVRYLKKTDGEPFWRKDIQYDFLEALFENEQRVFTNLFAYCTVPGFYGGAKYTFAELYVRTLAESSKCSKILKERLLKDFDMGKSVAKVCLLVNTGRMNTTINFVPEMRSTLRTYHSIPSLQADPSSGSTKPLQDTPRLKSILKAVSDTNEDFKTVEDLLNSPPQAKPNTNLVLLLFLLSNNVNGIKYHHLHDETCHHVSNSFMEFFLETKIHPKNRAQRFLWLMYTYLETNFKDEELAQNPFGGPTMPDIELVPDNELNNFDKDTDYEIEYSERMFRTRLKYLADEEHNSNPKRGNKPRKEDLEDDINIDSKILKSEDDKRPLEDAKDKKRKKIKLPPQLPDMDEDEEHDYDFDHVKFPLTGIKKIKTLNKFIPSKAPDYSISKEFKNNLNNKTKGLVDTDKVNPKKISLLKDWIMKFFQYKKQSGLLSMEWEEIRYDLVYGIEDYLNEFKGEELLKYGGKLPSDYQFKPDYEPSYDFELMNEKTDYLLNLLNISKDWIISKYNQEFEIPTISFDFENEKLIIE